MMASSHYHYGHGLTGHGPDEPRLCDDLMCLALCVRDSLDAIGDGWADQMHGERFYIEELRKARPSNGADPVGYPGSWESIADAALRALECLDRGNEAADLALDLRPERRQAPLYRLDTAAWERELKRLLFQSNTYPLETDITGNGKFYVWECDDWRCKLNEHDSGYTRPATCDDGGVVPCACGDCMDIVYWSPTSGEPPYCDACRADCMDRQRPSCEVDPDGI